MCFVTDTEESGHFRVRTSVSLDLSKNKSNYCLTSMDFFWWGDTEVCLVS